jgi:GntR family transcriptional regulator/MocR family aminotransferase
VVLVIGLKVQKAQAAEHGILIEAGDIHFLGDVAPLNYFRLGYSSINPKLIEPGIEKLALIMGQMLLV